MASFAGEDLGFIFAMNTTPAPKALQINAYAGANGIEAIDLGARGGKTALDAALFASNAPSLAALVQSFRSLQQDGSPYILVDDLGTVWSGVKLITFEPVDRVYPIVGGGYAKKYHAEFLHLS